MSHSQATPSNTLLKQSSADAGVDAVSEVLDRPEETDLLVVSYRDGPESWFRRLESLVGDLPPEVGFVNVGVKTRSGASAASSPPRSDPARRRSSPGGAPPVTAPVSDPTDLGTVGVRASEYLESWEDDGRRTVVVLDSVTAMLEKADLERVFSFLHLLAGRIESVDGCGYYFVDPSAHEDHVLAVIREHADRVIRLDPADGE